MSETVNGIQLPEASDAQVLDVAARQRMLNQRLMKEIVSQLLGADLDYKPTLSLMRQTSLALVSGGEVSAAPGKPASMALPPACTSQISAQLELQPGLIDALENAALGLLSTPVGSPRIAHNLSLLLAAGATFHVAADKGTHMLADHSQAQKEALERERDSTGAVRRILTVVAAQSRELTASSEELSSTSRQMQSRAKETSSQAGVVSEASKRITQVVQSLALATEQLNVSIREIASSANAAAKTTSSAVKIVMETNQAVLRLSQSSTDIGQVVKVINSVAQQTNLLALNATIEAARAGEAGKGFAVVAHEVKVLAKQTAGATEEIGRRIEAIQNDTRKAIEAIGQIDEVVDHISGASNIIAAAAEQQTAATRSISLDLAEAAEGASAIATEISGVVDVAQQTTAGAEEALAAATRLAGIAAELQTILVDFKA